MIRRVASLIIALCCASAYGGSIFDDDYVPPKETPAAKPIKPVRTPDPQPQPQPQPQPEQPAPKREGPARVEFDPKGGSGGNSRVRAPSPEELLQAALAAAQTKLQQAELAANKTLENDTAYVAVRDRAKIDTDGGKVDSPAAIQMQKLRDAALAKDAGYDGAKRYVTMLTRLSSGPKHRIYAEGNPPETEEEFLDGIKAAIAAHTLTEGMTFSESCKSARKPFTLMSKSGNTKTYHWILKGSTGSHRETRRDSLGRLHTETISTYGVIGYVEGVFEDDYLVSFTRGK